MTANERKSILLNLAGNLNVSLQEQLAALGVALLEASSLEGQVPDFVLVRDYNSQVDDISQQYGSAFIISLNSVDDVTAFAQKNGKAIINEKVISSSVGLPLLQRLFHSHVSTKLEMNFGALLENCMSLKISGHMNVGYFSDLVVNDAFSQDFRAMSLRAYLVFMSTYLAYLERGGICHYPIDLNYGATKDCYIVELVVPIHKFFLEYIYPALGKRNPNNPLENLLSECLSMSDYLSITQLKKAGKLIISSMWLKGEAPAFPSLSFCAIDSVKIFERHWQELKKHPEIELVVDHDVSMANEARSLPGPGLQPVMLEMQPQIVEEDETEVRIKSSISEKETVTKIKDSAPEKETITKIKASTPEKESIATIKGRYDQDQSKMVIKGDAGPKAEEEKIIISRDEAGVEPPEEVFVIKDTSHNNENEQEAKWTFKKEDDDEGKFSQVVSQKTPEEISEEDPLQIDLDAKNEQIKRMKTLMDNMREQMIAMFKKNKVTQSQQQTMSETVVQLRQELQAAKGKASENEFKLRSLEIQRGEENLQEDVEEAPTTDFEQEKQQLQSEIQALKDRSILKDKIIETQSRHLLSTINQLKAELEVAKTKVGERDFKLREMEAVVSKNEATIEDQNTSMGRLGGNVVPISTLRVLENELKASKESEARKERQIEHLQKQLAEAYERVESLSRQKADLPRAKEVASPSLFGPPDKPILTADQQRNLMTMNETLREKEALISKLNVDLKQSEVRQKESALEVKKLEQKLKMTLIQLQSSEKKKGKKGFAGQEGPNENQLQHKVKQMELTNATLIEQQNSMCEEVNDKKKEIIKLKQEINTLQNNNAVLERKLLGKDKAA